jgi:cytochrome c biogenesis protein CcdA
LLIGALASIGPCPLATNVAALSYTARQFSDRKAVMATGVLYASGRATAYALVGALIVMVGAQISRLATGLQDAADLLLGPLLIVVGLVLLGRSQPSLPGGSGTATRLGERVSSLHGGAFLLGFVFALAFCPYSAALFFGLVIPMALGSSVGWTLPVAFGVGTSLPVLVLGVPLALGIERAASGFDTVSRSEPIVRRAAALVFIAAGLFSLARYLQASTV